jgi:hypothetical protein
MPGFTGKHASGTVLLRHTTYRVASALAPYSPHVEGANLCKENEMRRLIPVLLACLALTATACGGGDSSGPASIAGTYTLQTVNNAPLPFTTSQDATYKAEILSWVVTLNEDKSYSFVFRGRSTDNGQPTENTITGTGTYTVSGSTVDMFDPSDNSHLGATVGENALTMVVDGPVGVFTLRFTR